MSARKRKPCACGGFFEPAGAFVHAERCGRPVRHGPHRLVHVAGAYLGAKAAKRDVENAATRAVLWAAEAFTRHAGPQDAMPLEDVVFMVAVKEAADLLDLYDRDPKRYPQGRGVEPALTFSLRSTRARYANGKCGLCKGPALDCARRRAHGGSCA